MTTLDFDHIERHNTFDDDRLASIIDKKFLEMEVGLFTAKWFDYRHLTPTQATRFYISNYGDIYRDVFAKERDRERAEHIKVIDLDEVLEGVRSGLPKFVRIFKSCWRGRVVADAIGMPYDLYIRWAFEFRLRFWNNRNLPQPQHLYQELDVERIQTRWEEYQAARTFYSEHPAYLNQNYAGIAHQDDHHEWLFKQAGLRSNVPETLARFISSDLLPAEKVESRLGQDGFAQVSSYLR